MPLLDTDRLRLRMFREDDLTTYLKIFSHPEVCRYLGDGNPIDRLEAWRQVAAILGHWQLRSYGLWAVEEKSTGTLIGRIGFIHPEGWPGLELGWSLAADQWGKGFATEAANACLNYGFSEFGFEHVISLIRPENLRSIAVAERIGEIPEREIEFLGKRVVVYGILKADRPPSV